jgi:hypothetical protein
MSGLLQLLFVYSFQVIGAPFLKEVEDREEDMESPNSCTIVEIGLDEIP